MKSIFFDWDGTLVDSLPLLYGAHNHVRGYLGVPLWSMEEYRQALIYSTRELYPKIYGERSEEAREKLYNYIRENHLKEISVLDGAEDVLKAVQALGVPMGLVSNKLDEIVKKEVEHLGWQKYFGIYNGAGLAAKDKPSGAPLLYALERHPDTPAIADVLYVGDTESDLACAADAGCAVAFVRHGQGHDDLMAKYKPAYVVDNLVELKEALIRHLNS